MSQLAKLVTSFSFYFREGFPIICDVVVEDESITACTSAAEEEVCFFGCTDCFSIILFPNPPLTVELCDRRRFFFQKCLIILSGLTRELRGICAVSLTAVVMIYSSKPRNKMAVSEKLGDFPLGVHAHPCQRCWLVYR